MKPDESLHWFVSVFNSGYPDWEYGELKSHQVEFSWTSRYWAKCGPRSGFNLVYFARNKDWWENNGTSARIGLLIHEITHYEETSHQPEFYSKMAKRYNNVKNNKSKLEDEIDEKIDFNDVAEWMIKDIQQHQVDTRKQTAYDARKEFAENISYDIPEQMAIDGLKISYSDHESTYDQFELVSNDKIDFSLKPISEVSEWLRNPHKDHVEIGHSTSYSIRTIPVKSKSDGKYTPVDEDGSYALSLVYHREKDFKIIVKTESD